MNLFNARFDITDGGYKDESTYYLAGTIVDNSGRYFGTDIQVGDIVYADGSMLGAALLRYKVKAINEADMSNVNLDVAWDIPVMEPLEPLGGLEGIIGAIHPNGLTANLTTFMANSANEVLISNAASYQNMLIGNGGEGTSPDLSQVNKRLTELEGKIESVKLEWEEALLLR